MTEKAAWALARDKELDMVVINPAIVLSPKITTSRASIMAYLKGVVASHSFPSPNCLIFMT
jgi:cinnamoyl-CoA reductase